VWLCKRPRWGNRCRVRASRARAGHVRAVTRWDYREEQAPGAEDQQPDDSRTEIWHEMSPVCALEPPPPCLCESSGPRPHSPVSVLRLRIVAMMWIRSQTVVLRNTWC